MDTLSGLKYPTLILAETSKDMGSGRDESRGLADCHCLCSECSERSTLFYLLFRLSTF